MIITCNIAKKSFVSIDASEFESMLIKVNVNF